MHQSAPLLAGAEWINSPSCTPRNPPRLHQGHAFFRLGPPESCFHVAEVLEQVHLVDETPLMGDRLDNSSLIWLAHSQTHNELRDFSVKFSSFFLSFKSFLTASQSEEFPIYSSFLLFILNIHFPPKKISCKSEPIPVTACQRIQSVAENLHELVNI